jgi:hypothetical protein
VVAVVGLFNSGLLPSLSSPSSKEKESSTNSAELSRSDAFSDDVKVDAIANPDDPDLSNSSSEMFARERNVARWVLENGGEVTVNYQTDDGWHGTRVTLVEALPAAPFVIQMIDLSNTVLSAQEQRQLGRLHELEGLHLNDRGTSDDVIFNLNPKWPLKWLYVTGQEVSDRGVAALFPYRETVLDVSHSRVTDESVRLLKPFPLLRGLLLENTAITDAAIPILAEFPALVSLDVSNTKVTGDGLAYLADCPDLTKLQVKNVPLSDDDLVKLAKLKLVELNVRGAGVSVNAVQRFRGTHPECRVTD